MRLDPQHVAGKRLLSLVDQRLTQQEKERKAQELARLAQKAAAEREWDRALALCDEALGLSPANNTLVALRKSVVEGKQTQEKVSQLLAESANARKVGELTRAQARAATAQRLDPHNSQVLALCRLLEQEIEEKRRQRRASDGDGCLPGNIWRRVSTKRLLCCWIKPGRLLRTTRKCCARRMN